MINDKQIKLIEKTLNCYSDYQKGDVDIWFHQRGGNELLIVWYDSIEDKFDYSGGIYSNKEFFKRLKLLAFE